MHSPLRALQSLGGNYRGDSTKQGEEHRKGGRGSISKISTFHAVKQGIIGMADRLIKSYVCVGQTDIDREIDPVPPVPKSIQS